MQNYTNNEDWMMYSIHYRLIKGYKDECLMWLSKNSIDH